MSINSVEDANIYLDSVGKHLDALAKLSIEAKLGTHAAIWLAIHAAFLKGPEEMTTISDIIGMYLEASTSRYMEEGEDA